MNGIKNFLTHKRNQYYTFVDQNALLITNLHLNY
jgi:hypothetical protein